jgi:hypothetical protein
VFHGWLATTRHVLNACATKRVSTEMPRGHTASLLDGSLNPGYHSRHDDLVPHRFHTAGINLFPIIIALIPLMYLPYEINWAVVIESHGRDTE